MVEEVSYEFKKSISTTNKYQVGCDFESTSENTDCTTSSNNSFDNKHYYKVAFDEKRKTVENNKTKYISQRLFFESPPQWWGWVIVFSVNLQMFIICGTLSSFGNFIDPLTKEFFSTKSITGCIGSIPYGFTLGLSPLSIKISRKYGIGNATLVGAVFVFAGLLASSFAKSEYMLLITYSMFFGTGACLCFNPALLLVGGYFPTKHQSLASCLATAGASLGSLGINPLVGMIVEKYGWRRSFIVLAAIFVFVQIIFFVLYYPFAGSECDSSGKEDEESIKKEFSSTTSSLYILRKFLVLLWLFSTLLRSLAATIPLIFLIDYVRVSSDESLTTANTILIVYGCFELFGRCFSGVFAEKFELSFSLYYVYIGIFSGITTILTSISETMMMYKIYAIVCGLASGFSNSLLYTASMNLFKELDGTIVYGYTNVMVAVGSVVGPTAAGALFYVNGSYKLPFEIAGGGLILSGVSLAFFLPLKSKCPLTKPNLGNL